MKKKMETTAKPNVKRGPSEDETSRRDGREARPVRPGAGKTVVSSGAAGAVTQAFTAEQQLKHFEEATRFFHSRHYREARESFERAMAGPSREVTHRAELHVKMCARRLEVPEVILTTADEHYNYAVALINLRNLAKADEHLRAALALAPAADYVYYALALCRALSGDLTSAYENLKAAIDLEPRNRIAARQDADFASFINQPPLDRLFQVDKAGPF
jgi:tetratricopeptide (TPR) repeat protein